ncbi:hypothetical protein BH11MYX3_BH11MYX3_21720 [soil metagenome]
MRLQLTVLLALTGAVSAETIDEPGASGGLHVYADDDHVIVVSPSAAVRADVAPRLSVSADTTVDVVSAASVDVVTSASPRTVHEQRVELGLASTYRVGRASWWTLGIRGSHEHDYDALRVRASGKAELAQRNTTLQLDYVFGYDDVTSVVDPTFHRDRTSHELMLGASQLLSPRGVVDIIADVTHAAGYHASPYRQILVDLPASPLGMRLDEVTPVRRTSLAIAVRARYALGVRWTMSATYRFYFDTWSVSSHTVTGELSRRVGEWLVGGTLRGYLQSDSAFYSPRYVGEPRYRTHDRTLGAMRTMYGALTLDRQLASWHLVMSAGLLRLTFHEFPQQADRNAILTFSSLGRTW